MAAHQTSTAPGVGIGGWAHAIKPAASSVVSWPGMKPKQFPGLLDPAADTVALGGHRGMGANSWQPSSSSSPASAPYRENTLKSFQRAVECGASFLEFDVQVTSDGVPVIWHDNYVVWGDEAQPTSRRISDLTFREFHQLAPINGSSEPEADVPMGASPTSSCMSFSSMDSGSSGANRLLRKLRNDAPAVPYEPTLRSWAVEQEDHFPTLADVFAGIPPSVAFDLEVKMAVPDDVAVTPAAEVDRMVSAILAAVDAGLAAHGPRLIVFSSFDPEVCLEIKQRRPDATVMFLSGGGVYAHVDERRTSVASAVDFAAGAGLQGVVLNTVALQRQGDVVEAARDRGLRIMTYGSLNDDPEWVRRQWYMGVQGVIVDDVAGVAAALSATLR